MPDGESGEAVRVAIALVETGDVAGAITLLDRALARFPNDPQVLTVLAALHRRQGRLRDALLHCDAAIRAAPGYADAWLERGFAFASGGSMARAGECYRQVLALDPGNVAAHAALASIAARDGDGEAARSHAGAALSGDPDNPTATLALAAAEIEHGDVDRARDLLEALVARLPEPVPDRSQAWTLLGDACARLGDADRAYAAYEHANADFAAIHAGHFAGRAPHREFVTQICEAVATIEFTPGSVGQPPRAAANHVFLLGYPRSGNTLLENALASLSEVVALEERPTMREADREFLAAPDGLARLAALTPAELRPYTDGYWERVVQAGIDPRGKTFVDMDPLKGTRLPLIARLFPQAKVLVMRRDPRDVVWSCFKTSFGLTNTAMDFTTLDGVAAHYDAMMHLIETSRERLQLAFHEVRYEALVTDFDATTQALCRFVGTPWNEAMRRFDRTAQARGVSTASAGQVRRGLYDGSGQWRPFARYLEPVMPRLEPWIERLGYA